MRLLRLQIFQIMINSLDGLDSRAIDKFLMNPQLVAGYFSTRFIKEISLELAKKVIRLKMDDLMKYIQCNFVGEETEVTFVNKESFEWWNNLLDNITVRKSSEAWYVIVPIPPKLIFEL